MAGGSMHHLIRKAVMIGALALVTTALSAATASASDYVHRLAGWLQIVQTAEAPEDQPGGSGPPVVAETVLDEQDVMSVLGVRVRSSAGEGRVGVSMSIQGRMAALGGRAVLTTPPGGGTEWELTVPRGSGSR